MKTLHPLKLGNGDVISYAGDVWKAWKQYLEQLYTPKDDARVDNDFKKVIEETIQQIENNGNLILDDIMKQEFTVKEIEKIVAKIKNGKDPGWDDIPADYITCGGDKLLWY